MKHPSRHRRPALLIVCAVLLTACNDNATVHAWSAAMAAANNSARLSWLAPAQNTDGTALTYISGDHIYVGTDPDSLGTILDVADATATSYTVSKLSPGTWYFAISAYNAEGADSELSNIGSKTIA